MIDPDKHLELLEAVHDMDAKQLAALIELAQRRYKSLLASIPSKKGDEGKLCNCTPKYLVGQRVRIHVVKPNGDLRVTFLEPVDPRALKRWGLGCDVKPRMFVPDIT